MRSFIRLSGLVLVALCLSAVALNAKSDYEKLFDKYSAMPGCQSTRIEKSMIRLMAQKAGSGDESSILGIDCILSLTVPDEVKGFSRELDEYFRKHPKLELLSSKHTGDESIEAFFYDGSKSDKRGLFALRRHSDGQIVVIFISGKFDLKSVKQLPSINL